MYDHNPDEDDTVRLSLTRLREYFEYPTRAQTQVRLEEAYARSPQRVRKHLRRILPFCDGKHTVEEIIFQSGVPRRSIRKVVETYPKILVVCTWCSSAKRENINGPAFSLFHKNANWNHLYHSFISQETHTRIATLKCTLKE